MIAKNLLRGILLIFLVNSFCGVVIAQKNYVYNTFSSTRVINSQSIETLWKKELDVRIGHRFGDLAGDNGGIQTFFGIEDIADVRIGADYGLTNDFTIGIARKKGIGPYRELYELTGKYKVFRQDYEKMPVSIVLFGAINASGSESDNSASSASNYENFTQRLSYVSQLMVARKFSERFSAQLIFSYTHRNLVVFDDENSLFSSGLAFRYRFSQLFGILGEYHYNFRDNNINEPQGLEYYNPMALGLEIYTGGHVFQLNFTNSRGFGATQYLPYTSANISDGEFRFGFTISRIIKL